MIFLNMPIVIVGAFLLLTLVVGIYFSRKETTFRAYAVGNKSFSTATLVATVLATYYSAGGLMRNVKCIYQFGLFWIIRNLFVNSFSRWLFSRLMLRMGPFMQSLSNAEMIGNVYGTYPRVITALVGICSSICFITIQIVVMSEAISICATLDSFNTQMVTIFATLVLIFYSMFGGVRSVTYTDILQFFTFSIIIPFLAWCIFQKTGKSVVEVVSFLKNEEKFQFRSLLNLDTKSLSMWSMMLCIMVPDMGQPDIMQRVYMSSGPIQAKRVFSYVSFLGFVITIFILLIGLFVFVGSGAVLPVEGVWNYIMNNTSPIFRGVICICFLAMAMSTADSCLNACSVIVSHDILNVFQNRKKFSDITRFKIARWTTLVVGLSSMSLAFYSKDLLDLLMLSFSFSLPVIAAPALLCVFGFKGTSRTALIGMGVGALSILVWNKWIKSTTGIDGSFLAMLANGLAMMAAHYLLKQPEGAGWVKPDNTFQQIQQEKTRRSIERKESIKNIWKNKKVALAKLVPSHTTMVCMGVYFFMVSLLAYFIVPSFTNHCYWLICHLSGSACCLGYPFLADISKKIRSIPRWFIGLVWLMVLGFYLPFQVFLKWWYPLNPSFSLALYLAHLSIILWLLPLYIGIGVVAVTSLVAIYSIYIGLSYPVLCSLFPIFLVALFIFSIVICLKVKVDNLTRQNIYLKDQAKIRESQKLKKTLYEAALVPSTASANPSKQYGSILSQVVRKVEESISFLDNRTPIYKEDLQSIMNKFYDWVHYFNKSAKAKDHALLQPTKISLDKLIRKVEIALYQEIDNPPKILVEKIRPPNGALHTHIVCDINQVVYSLIKAIIWISKIKESHAPIIKIQLHPTVLQFKQADPIDDSGPLLMDFKAIALLFSWSSDTDGSVPKVKPCYNEINCINGQKDIPLSIDLAQDTIASIVRAHYGYVEVSTDKRHPTILTVLPSDITEIRDKMTTRLPIDALTVETPVTPKEQADSMMELMRFYDYVCKSSCEEDPIDIKIISGIFLLLREHFGVKRHSSGQLLYVRTVGIAKLVVEWAFHSPKVIYASLLYGLVCRTCLPLSYVKEHYNLGVYAFVLNVVNINKRENLDHPSLIYVQNRLKKALKEDHVQLSVLFIELAERLYDLRHADGYIHLTEVKHMAQETLTIDVKIAYKYLGTEIAQALEEAAKQALEICNLKRRTKR